MSNLSSYPSGLASDKLKEGLITLFVARGLGFIAPKSFPQTISECWHKENVDDWVDTRVRCSKEYANLLDRAILLVFKNIVVAQDIIPDIIAQGKDEPDGDHHCGIGQLLGGCVDDS